MEIDKLHQYLNSKKDDFDCNIINQIRANKREAQECNDEQLANLLWCYLEICYIQNSYLEVYRLLKEDKYENYFQAWNLLDRIDIGLYNLRGNYDFSDGRFFLGFIETNIQEYVKLFPYEYFISREAVVKVEKCSICGIKRSFRNPCGHSAGKLYMGELCVNIIEDMELMALAIVKNPFDKYTVLFPEDKKYNYFMLQNLMSQLKSPYERWYVDILEVLKPIYKNIGRNQQCPCQSGKKYKKCCEGTKKELMNHHRIMLQENPYAKQIPAIIEGTWLN